MSRNAAIHFRAVDAGHLQPSCSPDAVFRRRGFWASKNTTQKTSRDRYTGRNWGERVRDMEADLARLGSGPKYAAAVRKNVCKDREDAHALHLYQAALERTIKAKAKLAGSASENPF